ncbi:MAG: calcium-binding protein [Chloroflexi bacterium]|nr:MAG: calcium-binding protein [Chloroflexota bacterium]
MLKHKIFVVLVLLGLLLTFAFISAFAQDNVSIPDDYNWCSDPNYWGDGRCNNTGDTTLDVCMWEMGWYLPRVQAGEYTLEQVAAVSGCVQLSPEPVPGAINIPVCDYYIVVLTGVSGATGSPYTGSYDEEVQADTYDGSSFALGSYCGLIIHGNNNDNTITGSAGDDQIYGYDGNDTIYGDSINGNGSGNDTIDGGAGNDLILGDSFLGTGSGNDTIDGGDGDDYIYGDSFAGDGSGNDTIDGGAGDDTILGDSYNGDDGGADTINGGDGDDWLYGDSVFGDGSGDDTINGGAGNDDIYGDSWTGVGSGNDTIDGGDGIDTAFGDTASGTAIGTNTCTNVENPHQCTNTP